MMKINIIFILVVLSGCAFFEYGLNSKSSSRKVLTTFKLKDQSGSFIVHRESGYKKNENLMIVKKRITMEEDLKKEFEKSITISELGTFKKQAMLRPKISQFTVWFDGKKYFSEMKVNTKTKSLVVSMKSPEKKWEGEETFLFPKGTGVYCFFNQIVECIRSTNFFNLVTEKGGGKINFHIIFDGYPYFQEQYSDVPKTVFTKASLIYDGKIKTGERRFSLVFGEQTVFYFIDDRGSLSKVFWVSQGLSMTIPKETRS